MAKKSEEKGRLNQSQAAKRANLAQWRASRTHAIEDLPSGLPIVVKDVSLQDLVMMEDVEIPNTLLDMMFDNDEKQAMFADDAQSDSQVILEMMRNKTEFNQLLNEMVRACLVSPPLGDKPDDEHITGDKPDDEHITLAELSFNDKMHIFNFLNREAQGMRPFPDDADAETAAQPVGSLQPETE